VVSRPEPQIAPTVFVDGHDALAPKPIVFGEVPQRLTVISPGTLLGRPETRCGQHGLLRSRTPERAASSAWTSDGRVAVLEFREEDPEVPIKALHKMTRTQIVREFTANGFEPDGSFDELPWQHLLFFRRAEYGE